MSVNNNRKCAKCGITRAEDMTVTYHRFPKPGRQTVIKAQRWAKYCWPAHDWTSFESLKSLHVSHKVLCGRHFTTSQFYDSNRLKLSIFAVPDIIESPPLSSDEQENEVYQGMKPILIVHGGAGNIPQSRVQGKLDGVRLAVREGYKLLLQNGSALDAVEAAVKSMEEDENFNAGYGSVLNLDEEVEMEASIMCGKNLDVGAVTLIKDFLHPISIARKVLTDSPHSFLGGAGAREFALEKGFPTVPPQSLISDNAIAALKKFLEQGGEFGETETGLAEGGVGTVGAVAIDANGHVAVATSTGGMTGKAVGRIGDTPQIGSGTYADDNVGGVSTTGHGESILKYCLAHTIIKLMEDGDSASKATKDAVTVVKLQE
ncbi:probable isoaspartyl peptidase/L-asparaginase GA20639 isoform X2 [Battus philenor]|uniref:probable isoaspartyl peptidase/L-asparaginase GA20639 isoform X2 n=1 Tax=Battus philenor TaxID=42288 RepID=UPI0035D0B964